jgi:hypothetical protein
MIVHVVAYAAIWALRRQCAGVPARALRKTRYPPSARTAGDHWIVVGQVDDLHIAPAEDPLVFFAGALGALKQRS